MTEIYNIKSLQVEEFLKDLSEHYQETPDDEKSTSLRDKIIKFRTMHNVSIQDLSKMTGVKSDLLSKIEAQEAYPSLNEVNKISKALENAQKAQVEKAIGNRYAILRKEEVKDSPHERKGLTKEDHMRNLAGDANKRHMKSFTITLSGSKKEPDFSCHEGEEFLLVVKGKIKVTLHDKEELLKEGDSIYYLSLIPHKVENMNETESIILAVVYNQQEDK